MPPGHPTYTLVLDWLEEQLRSGSIRVGDKLPSERLLAEQFEISRASVREAVRILDAMGLVRSSTGSGPSSGAVVISEASKALSWALRMHIATSSLPVRDIVQTRLLLESQSARDAAQNRECADRETILDAAEELLDAMDDPSMSSQDFHEHDSRFHILLTSLAGNVVVETIMGSLHQATVGYIQETVATLPDWTEVRRGLQEQHREILLACRERRGDDAAAALTRHITGFYSLSLT